MIATRAGCQATLAEAVSEATGEGDVATLRCRWEDLAAGLPRNTLQLPGPHGAPDPSPADAPARDGAASAPERPYL